MAREFPNLFALVVDVREAATNYEYPVVRHTFYGKSEREARSYLQAHLSTDAFLRDCIARRRYGTVECRTSITLRRPGEP